MVIVATTADPAGERERFSYQGDFFSCDDVAVTPRPVHRPRPPIWVGANSDAGMHRKVCDHLMVSFGGPDKLAANGALRPSGHPRLPLDRASWVGSVGRICPRPFAIFANMIPHNTDVEAELAIRQLAASYTDAVNRLSPEDAARVWAPDGVLYFFGNEVRADKLLKAYRKTFSSFHVLFQMTHSGLVAVDGDRATARWWISEFNHPLDGEPRMFYGCYQDEVIRTEVGWRFSRRQLDEIRSGPINFTAGEPRKVPTFVDL
jgi:alkanesulfonate monooxygenase SsuD/methylene tetrahydromethanopterin reductase-like flavin-dependent oxidoreductase (luciferase family)